MSNILKIPFYHNILIKYVVQWQIGPEV